VPSPILKSCLDDMALDNSENQFYDSDDEDDAPKKAKKADSGDPYAGLLSFKAGRSVNASVYYVDHSKQKNNGNGLEPDHRNELASNLAKAQEEESTLKATLQSMTKETAQLLSEPTNEEATATLARQEAEMVEIRDQLEQARALKVGFHVQCCTPYFISFFNLTLSALLFILGQREAQETDQDSHREHGPAVA